MPAGFVPLRHQHVGTRGNRLMGTFQRLYLADGGRSVVLGSVQPRPRIREGKGNYGNPLLQSHLKRLGKCRNEVGNETHPERRINLRSDVAYLFSHPLRSAGVDGPKHSESTCLGNGRRDPTAAETPHRGRHDGVRDTEGLGQAGLEHWLTLVAAAPLRARPGTYTIPWRVNRFLSIDDSSGPQDMRPVNVLQAYRQTLALALSRSSH